MFLRFHFSFIAGIRRSQSLWIKNPEEIVSVAYGGTASAVVAEVIQEWQ